MPIFMFLYIRVLALKYCNILVHSHLDNKLFGRRIYAGVLLRLLKCIA
jgi:hypothetical protein